MVGKSLTTLEGEIDLNTAFCEILGYSKDELKHKNWREITHKEDIEKNENIVQSILKGEQDSARWEKRYIHKNGDTVWADIITILRKDEKGSPLYFITELVDISQRKQAEKELEESEYRYRSLVNTGQALIWTSGLDKKCNYFNETWLAFTGRKLEQEIGDGWIEGVHPEDLQNCIDVYVNGFDKREFFSMEYRIRHHSGEYRWIQDDGSPRYNKQGIFLGYIGHCLDITDRKHISEALEKRIIALTKPLENDSDFAIEDLFNLSDLQKLQDDFSNATGVASIITYPDGTPITEPSNFTYLCDKIIRNTEIGCAKCYKSDSIMGELTLDGPTVQTCLSGGLWDAGSGISVGGKHIANWLIGQVRNEVQTEESALSYAHEIGADQEAYIKAFRQVPSMSRKRFEDIAQVVFTLSTQLSNSAYQNVQQARFITEQRQSKNDLLREKENVEKSQNFLDNILDNIGDPIFVKDKENKFVLVNSAFCSIFKLKKEDIIGKTLAEEVSPEEQELFLRIDKQVFLDGVENINEETITHRGGETRIISTKKNRYIDKYDNSYLIGIIRDITVNKKAEKTLKKVQQLHNEMEKIGKVGGWEFNIDTLKLNWTEETYRIHEVDYFNETTLGLGKNYYTHASRLIIDEAVNQAITLGKSFDLELEIMTAKGNFRNVHTIGQADIDNRRVYGFLQDITERKQAEKALKGSETKLSALFKGMTEMVVFHELVYDASKQIIDYRIIDCNETFTQITGIPKEVAIGELASKLYQTEKAPYLEEYSNVCITTKRIKFQTYFQPLDKHFVVSVISLGNNQFSTVTTDITEIQHSKEAIFRNNKELENYIYVASHDLRSPLVNIQGFSQRLQKQSTDLLRIIKESKVDNIDKLEILKIVDEDMPKSLNYVLTNVVKMDKLINGLLQVSRTGKMTMSPRHIDMNKLITSIIGSYNYQFTEINANVIINKLTSCYGDENQLNRLFSNLISNAIKYRCKERKLNIEISAESNYNKVIYSIRDNGIGIHQKYLDKMWDIFFRVDNKYEEGDGIGLSIVKRIVDLHKGKTWVESEEGIGSTFYVELQKDEFEI
jgi:PAS domain S-box-containing protein